VGQRAFMGMVILLFSFLGGEHFGVFQAHADQTDPRLETLFTELRTGGVVNAKANADRIIEIWSDAASDTTDILYGRALTKYQEGDYDTAGRLLTHIRGLSPNFMQAYALSGFVKLSINDEIGALEDFDKVLTLEPRQFEVRKVLAQMLLARDQKRDAYNMTQKALEWNPFDEQLIKISRQLRDDLLGQGI